MVLAWKCSGTDRAREEEGAMLVPNIPESVMHLSTTDRIYVN